MPSPPRLIPDIYYHIYNRGINRENIFFDERNYWHFLDLYEKYIHPIADTFAYCLLKNHFHLLVRIKSEEELQRISKTPNYPIDLVPSRRFADFFNAYAKSINQAYGRTGNLFQHPFGRVPIVSNPQFSQVIAYIHQNPQKHGLVDDFREWKFSSYSAFLSENPTHLQRTLVLDWFGGRDAYQKLHADWVVNLKEMAE